MKKILFYTMILVLVFIGYIGYTKTEKIRPFYKQLTKPRVGTEVDLQIDDQKEATFVGSEKCKKCHKENFKHWSHSRHPKMIQDIKKDPSVVVANFSKLPSDADFTLKDAIYTVGGKFKQRYMIRKDINGKEDYILGNYQWNVQTQKWQHFKPWKYWYKSAYPHENKELPTSKACDGCHFTGFMSTQKRVETGISCEACHGPASKHIKEPKSKVYLASLSDPVRQNEVCLQCHMRNRDMRLKNKTMKEIIGDARDYPFGYEAGKALSQYKLPAPFNGVETKEFYANGMGKKNRTQGNEYVHSMMGRHGITCINCHNPHTLEPTAKHNTGNTLCMKCHSFGSLIGPHQESIEKHTHHKANSKGSLCVECHMPKVGRHTGKSPITVRSHLFGFVTPDETLKYNMPKETNACFACHKDDKSGKRDMKTLQKDLESWGMVSWDKR
ncbi:TPR domain protein [hydrothermal vent metagenome]|uniref:TPR domain protein n=1 Tax=hydrothermal vent metagenome TaxID=652676 RepID=A0A1W1C2K6_9ZZZZ